MRSSERALVEEVESWPGVRLAVLFGSAARGESGPGSDWWDWAPTARFLHAAAVERLRAAVANGPS